MTRERNNLRLVFTQLSFILLPFVPKLLRICGQLLSVETSWVLFPFEIVLKLQQS